jgi:bifunctional DNA-binding transcriptional regulator/antitoxin component of YhaV-PrlF toxin-antitoxin module
LNNAERKTMSIKIGDKIRYIATSEDGEVVGASELSSECVSVRFGDSFEYLVDKDRLSLIACGPPRLPVIHRGYVG